jgi:hypothetical protein
MGVSASAFEKPWGYLAFGFALANKKLPQPKQGRIALIRFIAVGVSVDEVVILSTKDFNKRQEESQQKIAGEKQKIEVYRMSKG